ncbi:MAG: hypothetical protein HYX92_03220 [Chloroflexi bacterium]|nr:hypothetical protein [Chloroflexota bacterium]
MSSVSLVATGFLQQAHAIAKSLGAAHLAIAEYPGVPTIDSQEFLRKKVEEVLVEGIVRGLTSHVGDSVKPVEPEPRDIVFRGTLDDVQEFFCKNLWTDGLPIMPPTLDQVEKFLRFTDYPPHHGVGVLAPENREATIWNIAVNGVMAGCRPEYMPILVAVVEAISEPEFHIEDGGSTPGWEPLVILNGPIIKDLDFNCGSGVMRVGRQPNTSVGRFLRLYMRNVAGQRISPEATDKGSISYSFNVVLAENEDVVAELGWQPFSVDRGFERGENVVTVQSVVNISQPCYSAGPTPFEHLQTIAEVIGQSMAYWTPICAHRGQFFPLLIMSPSLAEVIAAGGLTKNDVAHYLYQNVKAPAGWMENLARQAAGTSFDFCPEVEEGVISRDFCQSTDPDRLVPVFLRPEWIGIVVSGDPGRNQSRGYVQNQKQGPPISKKIELPGKWKRLLADLTLAGPRPALVL